MNTEYEHRTPPFDDSLPVHGKPVIRVGAYANGELQIVIPCTTDREAIGIGKALESQGFQVRRREGASLPLTLAEGE